MNITISIDKFYDYVPGEKVPSAAELVSGEAAKLAPKVYGWRTQFDAPGGINKRGEPAQVVTNFRQEFFDSLDDQLDAEHKGNREAWAELLSKYFLTKVLPWNAPLEGVTGVMIDEDPILAERIFELLQQALARSIAQRTIEPKNGD
jgi:hypothetical protein